MSHISAILDPVELSKEGRICMSNSIRSRLPRYLWWLGIAYALCLSLHPYLIGCGCSHVGFHAGFHAEHTCGIVRYYACIGAVLWMLFVPVGLWLYRRAENMSILCLIIVFVQLLCTLVLLYTPVLFGDAVLDFTIRMVLTLPMVPYVGLAAVIGEETVLTVVLLYLLCVAAYGVYLYRRERQR